MEYPKTLTALKSLENQLTCSQCHNLPSTLCTLGDCEHLFCRKCCSNLLGTCCPECQIPVHVKDAQVNKQLSNLASLCHELGRILVSGPDTGKNTDRPLKDVQQSAPESECTKIPNGISETHNKDKAIFLEPKSKARKSSDKLENAQRKAPSRNTRLRKKSESKDEPVQSDLTPSSRRSSVGRGKESTTTKRRESSKNRQIKKSEVPSESEEEDEEDYVPTSCKSKNQNRNSRSSGDVKTTQVSANQSTMTQLWGSSGEEDSGPESDDDDDDDEEDGRLPSKAKRNKREPRLSDGVRKTGNKQSPKPADQSTMTQFYEYEDDEIPMLEMDETLDNSVIKQNETLPDARKTRMASREQVSDSKSRGRSRSKSKSKPKSSELNATPNSSGSTSKAGSKSRDSSQSKTASRAGSKKTTARSSPTFNKSPRKTGRNKSGSSQGESQTKRNARGETPLHVAAIKGDAERVKLLLESGAKPNVRDNAGWTPLHECCNHGFVAIVELLLNYGAMINTPGLENDTPLHDAVTNYRLDVAKLLVARGASINARNIHGLTPLDYAKTDEMKKILETSGTAASNIADESMMVGEEEFQPLCFLGTALPRDDGSKMRKCASMLQAKVLDSFSPEVSHVISACNKQGQCPRTLKYLHAILSGMWIVSVEWLDLCLEYKQKVCEEAFEIPGSSNNPETRAASKGRLNRRQQLPGLFDGCQFFFYGSFINPTPSKDELISLVKRGGGKILSREPKLHNIDDHTHTVPFHAGQSSALKDCGLFIVHDKKTSYPSVELSRLCVVTANWVMDCIGSFDLINPS